MSKKNNMTGPLTLVSVLMVVLATGSLIARADPLSIISLYIFGVFFGGVAIYYAKKEFPKSKFLRRL